jgi:hypothetical protein
VLGVIFREKLEPSLPEQYLTTAVALIYPYLAAMEAPALL